MKKIVPAPYIDQTERWVNGCESISSVMLLQAVGIDIDPDTFIARDLPHAPYWAQDGKLYEQNEIEFLPCAAEEAANQLTVAKWMIRNLGAEYGYDTRSPPRLPLARRALVSTST